MKQSGTLEEFWKNDLPEGIDPMTAKELRQSLRRGSFVLPFLGVHLLALVAVITEFQSGNMAAGTSEFVGTLNPWLILKSGPFWWIIGTVCMLIMPLGGLALMEQELEDGNYELLLLTQLNPWKVVSGKFTALWGMSAITFVSVLPYMLLRYFGGGIEWWDEVSCGATVLAYSAMTGAGAIGCSSIRGIGMRVVVMMLFFVSMTFGCFIPVCAIAIVSDGCGPYYQLTALAGAVCYTMIGFAMARSGLRLNVMPYEVKPSSKMIGMLILAPFAIGMITLLTCGYGGIAGLLGVAFVASRLTVTQGCGFLR